MLERLRGLVPAASNFDDTAIADLFDIADLVDDIQRRIAVLAEEAGMPSLHFFLLEHLALHGGAAPLSELLLALNVPKQSATYIVDQLEKQGLVERRMDERDRRRFEVALTQKGKRRVKSGLGPFYSSMLAAFDTVSHRDRTAILRGLGQFRDALSETAGDTA